MAELAVHLDTNAYTAFVRGDEAAVFILERAPRLVMSAVVLGELRAGFGFGSKQRENGLLLERFLASPRVAVAAVDEPVTREYARIYKQLRHDGHPIPTNDLWIAACVDFRSDVLFTLDRHFESVDGLTVIRGRDEFLALL